jgi:hypothetical protein
MVELCTASALTELLGTLMITVWSCFGRPASDVIARARLIGEIEAAAAALGKDLGGSLDTPAARLGAKEAGKFVGCLAPEGVELLLCFDGGSAPNGVADWTNPDTVIGYALQSGSLVRSDSSSGVATVVARHVVGFSVLDSTDRIHLEIDFEHRSHVRSIVIEAYKP